MASFSWLVATVVMAAGASAQGATLPGPAASRGSMLMSGGCEMVWEGNSGLTAMPCQVDLSSPASETLVVRYETGGTGEANVDYVAARGALTFAPGEMHRTVDVSIIGDLRPEGIETVTLVLTTASPFTQIAPMTSGYILNDDSLPVGADLSNGFLYRGDLDPRGSRDRAVAFFHVSLHAPESYEVVIDEVSGDAVPLMLEIPGTPPRLGEPVGTGTARSLRFDTSPYGVPPALGVAVYSGGCGVNCGPDDTYRLRFYETTLFGGRINNAGDTRTVLVLQNSGSGLVQGKVHFWTDDGGYVGAQPIDLAAHGSLTLDTTLRMPGLTGSVTVTHDAPYGVLQGKAATFDTATGFDSDSFLQAKLR